MRILVTGGAGLVGSHLCAYLVERGHQVTAYDNLSLGKKEFLAPVMDKSGFSFVERDLLEDRGLAEVVRGHDLVFHLAANSDISLGTQQTDLDLKQGMIVTYNVLEAMRVAGVKDLIFASSSAIYGEAKERPTKEDYGPLVPISLYGSGKLACEGFIAGFAHNYSMRAWIYRFANIVGANLTHGVIYDFLRKLRAEPKELKVLGNGKQKKSYLHVNDCIEGMLYGYENSKNEVNIFNLASEGVTEVNKIAKWVVDFAGSNAKIAFGSEDRGWKGDVPFTWLDGGALAKLGWSARLSSDEAVKAAISEAGGKNG